MAAKRGPTAYFLFADQHRKQVKEELQALGGEGAKVSVGAVGKALGAKWSALSDEEKDVYKDLAKQRAQEAAEAALREADEAGADAASQGGDQGGPASQQPDAADAPPPAGLPRGSVKRVMLADADVTRASADAVWLVGRAAELLVELLAGKCAGQAAAKKRSTIKLEDLGAVVRQDRRLCDAGLRDVVEDPGMYEAAAARAAAARAAKAPPAGQPEAALEEGAGEGQAAGGEGGEGRAAGAGAHKRARRAAGSGKVYKAAEVAKACHSITSFFVPRLEQQ